MLDALFNVLDLPGSSVRDLIAGENPFDQWTSPFNSDHRTSGSRLVSMYTGANPNSLGTTVAGIGAEMLLDPTNFIGGAGILKRMIGARRAMQANAAADAVDATRYGFVNPKVFSRAADTVEQVASPLRSNGVAGLLPYYDDKVTLHHASPHLWAAEPGFPYGRPRLDKAGTGEGATIRGYGFYAAENPEVVDSYYMHTLAREQPKEGAIDNWLSSHEQAVADLLDTARSNEFVWDSLQRYASDAKTFAGLRGSEAHTDLMATLRDGRYRIPKNEGDLKNSTYLIQKILGDLRADPGDIITDTDLEDRLFNIGDILSAGYDNYLDSFEVIPPNRYTLSAPKSAFQDMMISDEVLGDSTILNERLPEDMWEAIDSMANFDSSEVPYPNVDKWWDRESGELVQGLLQAVVASGDLPKRLYDKIPKEMFQRAKVRGDNDEIASFLMDQMGVKGNRHLDGLSRTGEVATPTYNHVYWNQDLLNQIKPRIINGVPVPLDDMLPMDKLTNRVRRSGADDEFLMSGSPLSPSRPRTPVPSYGGWATGLGTYNGLRVTTHE